MLGVEASKNFVGKECILELNGGIQKGFIFAETDDGIFLVDCHDTKIVYRVKVPRHNILCMVEEIEND